MGIEPTLERGRVPRERAIRGYALSFRPSTGDEPATAHLGPKLDLDVKRRA